MTRLFNLESYSALCTHANLYETEINTSFAYKNSLDKYQEHGYRSDSLYLQELTIQDKLIPLKHLGVNLSQDSDRLYVVGDRLNSLSLGNFLRSGEKYIYRSVYHYWNYRQQIANNLDLNNSVVIIDLNGLSNEPYCSLKFELWSDTTYQIPIIDNRGEVSNDFKLPLDIKDIHHNIYRALAQEILSSNFPQLASNQNTIEHLESYLQKIELFKLAQSQNESSSFSIIIEILDSQKKYYKSIDLDITLLENIVTNKIDIKAISQFTQKYLKYKFVLISHYNFLPKFRTALTGSKIFIPEKPSNEFPKIWQEKQQKNFPLFGQYLDKIKFQIKRKEKLEWIEVLSDKQDRIYYENESEKKEFIGRIQETGQEYFTLLHPDTILPIQINDRDYCVNEIIQEYQILHPLSEPEASLEELRVRIEFIIKLGFVPELKVTDRENKYKIEAKLQDRREIESSLNCIPLETILEYREQQFKTKVPHADLCNKITFSIFSINKIDSFKQLPSIEKHISSANKTIRLSRKKRRSEPFLYVNSHLESLKDLKLAINYFFDAGIIKAVTNYFDDSSNITVDKKESIKNTVINVFNFVGRTHKLAELHISQLFFDWQFIIKAIDNIGVSYYIFLAKVAFKKEFQSAYFSIFYLASKNKPCYQIKDYLWGYSRILLWYSEFYRQYQNKELDYLQHFKSISSYLLDNKMLAGSNRSQPYQQDAFLALIYLLTFREVDAKFCTKKSEEYQLAERVIEKYKLSLVYLKAVPDQSLNECFEELLHSNSSQESVRRIIEAD